MLFAPGLPDLTAVRAVCAAVSEPIKFMVGIRRKSFSVGELAQAGVRRISLATSFYRAAMTGLLDAPREVIDTGQFGFLGHCVATPEHEHHHANLTSTPSARNSCCEPHQAKRRSYGSDS
jgi:2-methylisocitrate lyase-like PEP mutase family enzyme